MLVPRSTNVNAIKYMFSPKVTCGNSNANPIGPCTNIIVLISIMIKLKQQM